MAGAGAGKTRTMVARAAFAVKRLGVPAKQIAFVTFTNRATNEIRERTSARLPGIDIGTIHQLARRVIKLVDGRAVQLSPLAEDQDLRRRHIRRWLAEAVAANPMLICDKQLRRNAASERRVDGKTVCTHRAPPNGQKMKSHGEVIVATLLHAAKIPYIYEATFPAPLAELSDMRDYRPDFFLPDPDSEPGVIRLDGGIWLEHYAHDKHGRAPKKFKGYEESRRWKRTLHERIGTRYIETSFGDIQRSWDGESPTIAEVMVAQIRDVGRQIDGPEWWTLDDDPNPEEEPTREMERCTIEIEAWMSAVRQQPVRDDRHRAKDARPGRDDADQGAYALRRLGTPILRRYEAHLRSTGTTDHDGTILDATECALRGAGSLPWKHVMTDEYQDVNRAQAAFLHALTVPGGPGETPPTLMGVGDDWQAIFGFQGGDSKLIRTAADPGGRVTSHCERITLENGYRFGPRLADASRALVITDENAADRNVVGRGPDPVGGLRPISVASCSATEMGTAEVPDARTQTTRAIILALEHWIPTHEAKDDEDAEKPLTAMVMGRRRMDVEEPPPDSRGGVGIDTMQIRDAAHRMGIEIDFRTIHGAKGSEADYAILLDSGPSRIKARLPERALQRALEIEAGPREDDEYRLWYVALTRARFASLVLVSDRDGATSQATKTLLTSTDPRITIDIEHLAEWLTPVQPGLPCPGCNPDATGDGQLATRTGRSGHFAGCTEWTGGDDAGSCSYTQPMCAACGEGMLELEADGRFRCRDQGCRQVVPACSCNPPRPMVVRRQRTTEKRFWGCWKYGDPDCCRRTRNID